MCSLGVTDIVTIIFFVNVALSLLEVALSHAKDKTESKLDDRAYILVSYIHEALTWLMANTKRPGK